MSKIRDLFKNVFKKKKKNQDLEDVFYEESDLTENTVILPEGSKDYDLAPAHPNQSEKKIPTTQDLDYPPGEEELEDDTDIIEDSFDDTLIIDEPPLDEIPDPVMAKEEAPQEMSIPESEMIAELDLEEDSEDLLEEEVYSEYEDDEVGEEYEDDYSSDYDESDITNEIDLDEETLTIKDRIEHLGTRVTDRFRNLGKKDLNQAFKEKPKSNLTQKIDLNAIKSKASAIDWKSIPAKFFKDEQMPKYHRYFQVGGIAITLTVVASLIGMLISGGRDYKEYGRSADVALNNTGAVNRQDISTIKDSNLFKAERKIAKPVEKGPTKVPTTACTKATQRSSLNVKLVDTIVLQDSVKSIASVQINSKKDLLIGREGDTLDNMKIGKIESTKLIFRNLNNQNCEYVEQKQKRRTKRTRPPKIMSKSQVTQFKKEKMPIEGISQEGNNYKIKRDFLKSKLSDINTILTQAKGLQIKNPDGSMSFKIVDVDPEGIFAYLGVEDGDVINNINGEPIRDLNEVLNLFGKITSLNNLSLGFVRNGESVTKSYSIE